MSMCIQLSLFALLIIILLVKCVAVCSSECTDASCGNSYLSHFVSTLKNRKYCPLDEGSQRQCDCDSEWSGTGLHPFKKYTTWKLSEQLLLREFPVDTVKENYVRTVPNALFSAVNPIPFKSRSVLVAYSADVLTKILDLDIESTLTSSEWLDIVSGTITVPGSIPLAHRYGGHQFGVWASQLGDGRAVMIGEYLNSKGERWELQLKGSGKTPYSRQGDGRAVLRSSVREFLCSEAMYYLGIPTSRAASLVLSTDTTLRDQFYNGNVKSERCAVVLRLAKSWFRFGSLEILTANEELDLLKHLVNFITRMYFIDIGMDDPDKYLMFLNDVVNQTAILMAQWMTVGFTHGVMNTDNFSILSITMDYGPFGFLDGYDPQFVPNTSDDEKRYSFERQPDVGYFNLEKLFSAMQPLLTVRQRSYGRYILDSYVDIYKHQYMKLMRNKLGLQGTDKKDEYLVAMLLKIMAEEKADFTMTFRNLGEISMQDLIQNNIDTEFWSLRDMSRNKYFKKWVELYAKRLNATGPFHDEVRQKTMLENNPRYILRNWIAQTAIEHVEREDYTMIRTILRILKQPFILQEEAELLGFASRPPYWADKLKVSCSS